MLKVTKHSIEHCDNHCKISVLIESQELSKKLWFSVPAKYSNYLNRDSLDPFALALLPLALQRNEDLYIDGAISENLNYNFNYLVSALMEVTGYKNNISIYASEIHAVSEAKIEKLGAATGFSAGIDSFCTIADHTSDRISVSYKLNTLLFNNVGAVSSNVFYEKLRQLSSIEDFLGIELIAIDSNLDDITPLTFYQTHSIRNAACSHVLKGLYSNFLYSSGVHLKDTQIAQGDIAFADTAILNLMSSNSLSIISTGGRYTRVEKTKIVSRFPASYNLLNVCVAPNRIDNCSKCWKCGRTLLTLELLGKVNEYNRVFDLDVWRASREQYIAEFVTNPKKVKDPFNVEIYELAQKHNFKFSFKNKLAGLIAAYLPQSVFRRIMNLASKRRD